jgi:hypothetical protein
MIRRSTRERHGNKKGNHRWVVALLEPNGF